MRCIKLSWAYRITPLLDYSLWLMGFIKIWWISDLGLKLSWHTFRNYSLCQKVFLRVYKCVYNFCRPLRIFRPEGTDENFIMKAISMILDIKLLYLSFEDKSPLTNSCSNKYWTIYKPDPQSFDLAYELFVGDVIIKITLSVKVSCQW